MHEGEIIQFLRKEKKISQSVLAEGICTVRHLSNIETGKSSVSYDLMLQFMEKLGTDMGLVMNVDVKKYGFELFKSFKEMERCFYAWQYQKLYDLVMDILERYILESYMVKKLKYYQAVCVYELRKDQQSVQNIIFEALRIDNLKELKQRMKHYNDALELDMINVLAVSYAYAGNKIQSKEIFQGIRKLLEKYENLESDFGVKVLFNLTRLNYDTGFYEVGIEAAGRCIDICERKKIVRFMPEAYYYTARCKKALDQPYQLEFKKSLYLNKLFKEYNKLKATFDEVIESNNLAMDVDFQLF